MGGHLAICSILKKKQENRQKESSGNWFISHRNDHKPKSNNEDKFEMFLSSHLWLIYAVILEFEFLFRVLGIVGIPSQLLHALSKISGTRMKERNSKIPPPYRQFLDSSLLVELWRVIGTFSMCSTLAQSWEKERSRSIDPDGILYFWVMYWEENSNEYTCFSNIYNCKFRSRKTLQKILSWFDPDQSWCWPEAWDLIRYRWREIMGLDK